VPDVLLATFALLPDGEHGGDRLVSELARRGVDARWASWDDPAVDWSAADLVAVRSTWDYHRRLAGFLAWARRVEAGPRVLNGGEVFAWNADKSYLTAIADRVPAVPTALLDDGDLRGGLAAALERWGAVVVKARTGASGVGVVLVERVDDPRLAGLTAGPWVVQPLVASVRTRGETSVFVLDGRAVAQVDKRPGGEEIRVHEQYGGASRPVDLDDVAAQAATRAVRGVSDLLGAGLDYARVDLMELEGRLVVSEIELIEPGLYLDLVPDNAAAFADLVVDRLDARGRARGPGDRGRP
jgi:glutathione synthase/RimK-type ligase-like ATP-grasp enzyme